jgi:transcriptional regulator with XRE-family HTH domain
MKTVTLGDLAERLGMSRMTVSRALRKTGRVSAETVQRVAAAAAEMGYVPNPAVGRYMAEIRQARTEEFRETLGFIWPDWTRQQVREVGWLSLMEEMARHRAARLGYGLDTFYVKELGVPRLERILETRGITGLVLGPILGRTHGHLHLRWERYAAVLIGRGLWKPRMHRVHVNHHLAMVMALRELKRQGWKRIGFISSPIYEEMGFWAQEGAFLCNHPLSVAAAAKLVFRWRGDVQALVRWGRATKPEVILQELPGAGWIEAAFAKAGLPVPMLVTLGWNRSHPEVPGIDQMVERLGSHAVDVVAAQLAAGEKGLPTQARTVQCDPRWVGELARNRRVT